MRDTPTRSASAHVLLTHQLTFDSPCVQVPVRRVSPEEVHGPLHEANRDFLQLYASHEGALEEEACRVRVTE